MLKNQTKICVECNAVHTVIGNLSTLLVCRNCSNIIGNETSIDIAKRTLIDGWSTIRIGSKGKYKERTFEIIGRIHLLLRRDYKDFWCVWMEEDRAYAWLMESFGRYAFCQDSLFNIEGSVDLYLAQKVNLTDRTDVVIDLIDRCDYLAYEGESKGWQDFNEGFEVAQGTTEKFFAFFICSKKNAEMKFLLGEWVDFEDLKLSQIRDWDKAVEIRNEITIPCPSCKHVNIPRGRSLTLALTCESCGKYFTNRKWSKQVVKFNEVAVPAIPIGAKGKIDGITYEVMSFAVKYVRKYKYRWREYLLFNPNKGQVYLSEYDGHWNFMRPVPFFEKPKAKTEFYYKNNQFRLYQKFHATIVFAKGEFFTDAFSITEGTHCEEHIAPPYLLSVEHDSASYRWFEGEYKSRDEISNAFTSTSLVLPPKKGRGYTQPVIDSFSPQSIIQLCFITFFLVIGIQFFFAETSQEKEVFEQTFHRPEGSADQKMLVTPSFYLEGSSKSLVLQLTAPVNNDWFYGEFTLINESDNSEYDFSKEIEYYSGVEEGEAWSEGTIQEEAFLSRIPGGSYHINIYPQFSNYNNQFSIRVIRDVANFSNMWLTLLILSIFPIFYFIRRYHIERKRWSDSDYSPYDN